jgi:hypothetical protein
MVTELSFDYVERGFDVRPLMIVFEELVAVELVIEDGFPKQPAA